MQRILGRAGGARTAADCHGCTCFPPTLLLQPPPAPGRGRGDPPFPEQTGTIPQIRETFTPLLAPPCPLPVPSCSAPPGNCGCLGGTPCYRQLSPCPQSWVSPKLCPGWSFSSASPSWGHPAPPGVTSPGGIKCPQGPPSAQLCSSPDKKKKTHRIF